MNALIPHKSIETIVQFRDRAVAAYIAAFDKIADADAALKEAASLWKAAAGDCMSIGPNERDVAEVRAFNHAVALPDPAQWERTVIRLIDISCWHYLVKMTELEVLMDRKAKDELRDTLQWVPERYSYDRTGNSRELVNPDEIVGIPPVTIDNVYSTIEKWAGEADMIFRRGIATAFSSLDRRFRSHDGFKIGSRVILTYAFSDSGSMTHGRTWETIRDIERTFSVLDGKKPNYNGIEHVVRMERPGWTRMQSEHEGSYFRIKAFMNGNAHLWFTRDDLVEQVNKLLAEYYGEVIGDGMTKEADPFANVKRTPAKRFGFFPTPDEPADIVIGATPLLRGIDSERATILEPSAGTGNLARRCVRSFADEARSDAWRHRPEEMARWAARYRWDNQVDCIEIQPEHAEALRAEGIYRKVYTADFLNMRPSTTGLYDMVVMNPPFDLERDIDHVRHALDFLKPNGWLTAIMSAGTEYRETKKAVAFRSLIEKLNGRFTDLPAGSFASVGTYVNTIFVKVRNDGGSVGW